MSFIQPKSREQLFFTSWDQMVPSDSWARVVDLFVSMLPLKDLGFPIQSETQGRSPYHPATLLKLYFYGYKKGIRSSRKLEKQCLINLEVIWLLGDLKPCARKIAYFRKNNQKAFQAAFRYFVGVLKDLNLIEGETIAIDSFKIRAQNSLKNNYNQNKINRHLQYIDQKIEVFQNELDQNDQGITASREEVLVNKIEQKKVQRAKYEQLEEQLKVSKHKQISTTDPDSKSVMFQRNAVKVGYNIQAAVDQKHKLFITNAIGGVNDTHALAEVAITSKKLLDVNTLNVLSDKGYTTGVQIAKCTAENIVTYSSPKAHSSQHNGLYAMQEFEYNSKKDTYTCPAGEILTTNGTIYNKANHKVKHYKNRSACKTCNLRQQCTKNKNGRFIERSIYQEDLEGNQKRVEQNPEYYRKRQQIIEHQFGTLKRQWGFTFTLMKGKENVLTEVNILMICYNLRRLISIYGQNPLKALLRRYTRLFKFDKRLVLSIFKQFSKWISQPIFTKQDFQNTLIWTQISSKNSIFNPKVSFCADSRPLCNVY